MTVVSLKTEILRPGSREPGAEFRDSFSGDARAEELVKAEFSDGSSLVFSTEYLNDRIVFDEKAEGGAWELTPDEEDAVRFAADCLGAEKAALRLIARAEQNSRGLTAKLEHRGFDSRTVKAVISCLLKRNLLDDGRFAELWIRSRLACGKAVSPRRLFISLVQRGVGRNFSQAALEEVLDFETEYALFLRYLDKMDRKNNKKAGILKAHLKFEGFSSPVLNHYFDSQ